MKVCFKKFNTSALFFHKIWFSMLRLWGLLSDGLQNVFTGLPSKGGKQEINLELHLCVNVKAVMF